MSSKPLLLLHEHHTPDDADIWRVAIRRGWTTERVNRFNVAARLAGHDHVRYYGNLLNHAMIESQLPIKMTEIDPAALPALSAFTHRRIELTQFKRLSQPIRHRSFIKPVCVKWFEARVYEADELVTGAPELNDLVYVQNVVEWVDEVRCFCLDGIVLTSSLYRINKAIYSATGLPESEINFDAKLAGTPIPAMAAAIHATGLLPRAIVMDFGTHPDGSWSLIEFNEPWCSGLYLCDPERCFDVIVETQIAKVV